MSHVPSSSSSPPTGSLPSNYSALSLFNSSFNDTALAAKIPLAHFPPSLNAKKERDLKKRLAFESRRHRTPMSCDTCKSRKIKVSINAPCLFCTAC